jgi:hypothetical protein
MRRRHHKNLRPRRTLPIETDRRSIRKLWLIIFVLLSLLAHVLLVLSIVFIAWHTPKPRALAQDAPPPQVSLTLQPAPRQRPNFIPTEPDEGAPPQKSPLISDNDQRLHSKNRVARAPNVPMPDVTGKNHHASLRETPSSPPTKNPDTNPSPPTAEQQQQQPTPPTPPKPAKPTKPTKPAPPQPDQPSALTPMATPLKAKPQKPVPQDPNGLPVLPSIDAPTLAPQETVTTQQVTPMQRRRASSPPPSFAVHQSDVSGAAGIQGDNSAQAMATDLGRYKAKVYRAVGARWYTGVNSQIQLLGVGTVHITYTIHSDGRMEIMADPDSNNASLMLLHTISLDAMLRSSPFDPFSDAMKRDVGESYTDDFTFSVYGD